MSEKLEEMKKRYRAAAHAMQTGVAYMMNHDADETHPKHLRVGINSALVDVAGLARLLMDKGVITEEEYYEAITRQMELEAAGYQQLVNKHVGVTGRIILK